MKKNKSKDKGDEWEEYYSVKDKDKKIVIDCVCPICDIEIYYDYKRGAGFCSNCNTNVDGVRIDEK